MQRSDTVDADRAAFALAARQHGAVGAAQLAATGLVHTSVAYRVRRGMLTRFFRGVYLVGPLESEWTRAAAALLACGPNAVLSHAVAAALWGILTNRPGEIDVTIVRGHRAGQRGIRVHHAALTSPELRRRQNLPLTAPARTLLDLAATLPPRELARAVNEAQIQRLATPHELRSYLARRSGHRGARALVDVLAQEPHLTRSDAEGLLLELVRKIGLPEPLANARVGGYEVDALWRQERVIVEVDSWQFHHTRAAFERDRRKTQDLEALGYRVLRITAWQLAHEPEVVAARLAVALTRA